MDQDEADRQLGGQPTRQTPYVTRASTRSEAKAPAPPSASHTTSSALRAFRVRAAEALSTTFAEEEYIPLTTLLEAVNAAGPTPIPEEDARNALEAMSEDNQIMIAEGTWMQQLTPDMVYKI